MRFVSILSEDPFKSKHSKSCRWERGGSEEIRHVTYRGRAHCLRNDGRGFTTRQTTRPSQTDPAALEERRAGHLLRRFSRGDATAFWELWNLYKAHLYHLCLWQMGVREDAEDALSRAMLRALDKLPANYGEIQNIRAWLSKLTLNMCVDMHRERIRQVRRLESIEDAHLDTAAMAVASTDSPEEGLLTREVFDYMCDAVDDLPPRLREPFVLRFFHEMAYPDIANSLILSTENVRKRIQQARDILKPRLQRVRASGHGAARRAQRAATA
jgi:RNA polymerase sigma factor (sigma-70 family)